MKEQVLDSILRNKVVAILRNVDDDKIYPTAEALYAGGIRLLEVTFNQSGPDPIGGPDCGHDFLLQFHQILDVVFQASAARSARSAGCARSLRVECI